MRLKLIKDWVITSSEGDLSYTLKQVRTVQDKDSTNFGQEYDIGGIYPTTIERALEIVFEREKYNSKVGDGKHNKTDKELWHEYVEEVRALKNEIHILAEKIGIDKLNLPVEKQSKEFLSYSEEPLEEKPKRGRKKKE